MQESAKEKIQSELKNIEASILEASRLGESSFSVKWQYLMSTVKCLKAIGYKVSTEFENNRVCTTISWE